MDTFSSPLTAPPTSPEMDTGKRGTKRKLFVAGPTTEPAQPETPTKRAGPVIDLCTPSPAAGGKVYDLLGLGKRRPLIEVGVPNLVLPAAADAGGDGKTAEGDRSSFEGYLALCRMTRQASRRSVVGTQQGPMEPTQQTPTTDATTTTTTGDAAPESEEDKARQLREWKARNAQAVIARSRGALVTNRLPPGKGFLRPTRVARPSDATPSTTTTVVDTLPRIRTRYLSTFASHQHQDVLYVEPNPEHSAFRRRDWSPVYACAYSHAAKRTPQPDGPTLLALASESGAIRLVDTRPGHSTARGGSYSLYPHQNAIFDVQWDAADSRLLTASGDQTGAVHRLSEGEARREALLVGHTSSVKTCAWYDQNTVLTAGRDGNILIFDLRTTGHWNDELGMDEGRYARARAGNGGGGYWDTGRICPVMTVRNAHGENCGKRVSARSAVRSVTSLLAVKTDPNLIASGGSADGIVKFWDLRAQMASTRRIYVSESVSQTLDRTADRGKRSRGVISLVEASGNVYAMCNDARIHSHSIQSPQIPLPTYYTHQALNSSSFYLKLAVSPCENFLACGGSEGRFVMWGIQRDFLAPWNWTRKEDPVVNAIEGVECGWGGHSRQVGAIDWAVDQIATGSDDYSSRIWRPDPRATGLMRDRAVEGSYWAGCVKR